MDFFDSDIVRHEVSEHCEEATTATTAASSTTAATTTAVVPMALVFQEDDSYVKIEPDSLGADLDNETVLDVTIEFATTQEDGILLLAGKDEPLTVEISAYVLLPVILSDL